MCLSSSGLIVRSLVATIAQLFFVRHAGLTFAVVKARFEARTCDLAMKDASLAGRSAAKSAWKTAGSKYRYSPSAVGFTPELAGGLEVANVIRLSPWSGWNAAT